MKKFIIFSVAFLTVFELFSVTIQKGNPSKIDWKDIPAMKFHRWRQSGEPPIDTQARFMYDDNRLYIRVECSEPNINEARSQLRFGKHDSTCWVNDCVEFFIDLLDGTGFGYQFVTDIHNDGAELIWRDPKFVNTIAWNGYWNHRVIYGDDNFVVLLEIPWKTFGVTELKNKTIAMNITRNRKIAPWGRFVLSEKTDKNLTLSDYYLRFENINVRPAAVTGTVSNTTPLTGKNSAKCSVTSKIAVSGTLEFASEVESKERIMAVKKVTFEPGKVQNIVLDYEETIPGMHAVRVIFRDEKGEVTDVWADNINYNVPLELANTNPVSKCGQDFNIFARLFIPVKGVEIVSAIYQEGKCVAEAAYKPEKNEFFLPLPGSKLAPGKYDVKITLNDGKSKVTQTLSLFITPAL